MEKKSSSVYLVEHSFNFFQKKLNGDGLKIKIGPFNVCLTSPIKSVLLHLQALYGTFSIVPPDDFIDFYLSLEPTLGIRKWIHPQVNFSFDGNKPFLPLPLSQAGAMFEWGLNWCIANHSHQYLIIHAAVAERNGSVFIFPGAPGSGKSTLCAALVQNGWRLFSDEMGLISVRDNRLYPVPRPISLKNESIDVINNLYSDAVFGEVFLDTAKGKLSHLRPPEHSVLTKNPSNASNIIFPIFKKESGSNLEPIKKSLALIMLAENSFNYNVLGLVGFKSLCQVVDESDCYQFTYSNISEAIEIMESLSD